MRPAFQANQDVIVDCSTKLILLPEIFSVIYGDMFVFFVFQQEKQVCICPAVLYCDLSKETVQFFHVNSLSMNFHFVCHCSAHPPKSAPKPTPKHQIQTSSHFTLVLGMHV